MEVQFTHEKINQIEIIKNAIKKDFKKLGFEHRPEAIDDNLALEYALSFTSEIVAMKWQSENDKQMEFTQGPNGGKSLRIY